MGTFSGKHHTFRANEKNRQAHLGRKHSEETKHKMSLVRKGVPKSAGAKAKLSIAMKGKIPWNKDKQYKNPKMSLSKLGHFVSEETRRKLSECQKGQRKSPATEFKRGEHRSSATEFKKGHMPSPDCLRKLRLLLLERVQQNRAAGAQIFPFYNSRACDWFRQFDETNQTQGQYATNGGEYLIVGLGYFLDYINHEKRLIIEWDEEYHYKQGKLRDKDVRREREIKAAFPGYVFIRIRESNGTPDAAQLLSG